MGSKTPCPPPESPTGETFYPQPTVSAAAGGTPGGGAANPTSNPAFSAGVPGGPGGGGGARINTLAENLRYFGTSQMNHLQAAAAAAAATAAVPGHPAATHPGLPMGHPGAGHPGGQPHQQQGLPPPPHPHHLHPLVGAAAAAAATGGIGGGGALGNSGNISNGMAAATVAMMNSQQQQQQQPAVNSSSSMSGGGGGGQGHPGSMSNGPSGTTVAKELADMSQSFLGPRIWGGDKSGINTNSICLFALFKFLEGKSMTPCWGKYSLQQLPNLCLRHSKGAVSAQKAL